eukprot:gb/GEZN01004660.1/.p1 GENE.gb/GEZN01004660.1/~~gb/GEZN01004660.1/.p1  ORF type:complete len:572 (+),score=67.05 gb/GEZN01004660.1/:67-1782(+)
MSQHPSMEVGFLNGSKQGNAPSQKDNKKEYKEVRVRVSIKRIVDVDLVGQRFICEFFMEASWIDCDIMKKHRLDDTKSFNGAEPYQADLKESDFPNGKLRLRGDDVNRFFTPRLSFRNLIEFTRQEEWAQIFPPSQKNWNAWRENGEKGSPPLATVCYRLRATGEFQEKMELHLFPVDSQDLSMELTSGYESPYSIMTSTEVSYDAYQVHLIQNLSQKYRSFVNSKNFFFENEYSIESGAKFVQTFTEASESASNRQYSVLRISAVIRRKSGFWAWNVVLPLYLITATASACFAVPQTQVADRASITLTMMLTTVAYKYLIAGNLPNISYLTLIDKYVLLCLILQVCFVVATVIIGSIATNRQYKNMLKDPDYIHKPFEVEPWISLTAFFSVWTLLHILGYFYVEHLKQQKAEEVSASNNHVWVKGFKKEVKGRMIQADYVDALKHLKQLDPKRWVSLPLTIGSGSSPCRITSWTNKEAMEDSQNGEDRYKSKDIFGTFLICTFGTEDLARAFTQVIPEYLKADRVDCEKLQCVEGDPKQVVIESLKREWFFLAEKGYSTAPSARATSGRI